MDDLISRQGTIKALDDLCDRECEYSKQQRSFMCGACRLGSAFDVIDDLPSAQPESHREWYMKGYRDAQRWIPVTERLPDVWQRVLCQCRANIMDVLRLTDYGCWYRKSNEIYMSSFVLAWMPLPEPYKGGADMRGTDNDA